MNTIADFAPHDREELRARDAHTRLGFSDAQIERWFTAAGLTLYSMSQYLMEGWQQYRKR